ncbi:MAG: pyridoxamine 5'-phosphate oxidase [Opitutae bacterium]|nr:pyridoxamine 5'-phosphate oxidase [Opitutae bacterium]MBT5716791.1 pyridoxamine 5'-phosphate oxidase [Opitutae bacterium]
MREEYDGKPLFKADLDDCPFAQFSSWLIEAQQAKVPDPNACSLGTVDENAKPMARAVLLKGMEDEMFTFYTNYKSRKARHLENNPYATMHFPWFSMERQVIVSGKVTKVAVDQSDEYFQSRPLMSRLGAWASRQSEVLDSRETLEKAFIDARDKLGEQPEKPPHWGGYALEPDSIEFWQGGPSRLHDRFIYRLTNGENLWNVERFYP